jgi:hypothetical protein
MQGKMQAGNHVTPIFLLPLLIICIEELMNQTFPELTEAYWKKFKAFQLEQQELKKKRAQLAAQREAERIAKERKAAKAAEAAEKKKLQAKSQTKTSKNQTKTKTDKTNASTSKSSSKASNPKKRKTPVPQQYVVEAILDRTKIKGKVHYLVKWWGFPEDQNSWEPISSLLSCPDIVNEFNRQFKTAKKPRTSSSSSIQTVESTESTKQIIEDRDEVVVDSNDNSENDEMENNQPEVNLVAEANSEEELDEPEESMDLVETNTLEAKLEDNDLESIQETIEEQANESEEEQEQQVSNPDDNENTLDYSGLSSGTEDESGEPTPDESVETPQIEEIIDIRQICDWAPKEYLVKWQGLPVHESTWVREEDIDPMLRLS